METNKLRIFGKVIECYIFWQALSGSLAAFVRYCIFQNIIAKLKYRRNYKYTYGIKLSQLSFCDTGLVVIRIYTKYIHKVKDC